MYPIVKSMLDEICEAAKQEMKDKKEDELGSWKRAVTVADGTWQTRGWHSKNATFTIKNYLYVSMYHSTVAYILPGQCCPAYYLCVLVQAHPPSLPLMTLHDYEVLAPTTCNHSGMTSLYFTHHLSCIYNIQY